MNMADIINPEPSMKSWFSIQNSADGGAPARISIHDEIGGWGIMARDFIREFDALPQDAAIELSVYSPGGSVFEALAIYHVLNRARERITARVEGLAASAASLIVMAAGRIEMPENAYLMIHNPWAYSVGNAASMRDMADLLEKMQGSLARIYATKTGKDDAEIQALLDAETWMTGQEAVDAGFADAVIDAAPVAASLSDEARAKFLRVPQALAATQDTDPPEPDADDVPIDPEPVAMPADEVAAQCADAGFGKLAASLIRAKASAEDVVARLTEAREIAALAIAAGRPEDADMHILAGLSVESARAKLIAARAASAPPIDPHARSSEDYAAPEEPSHASTSVAARLNPSNIYTRRQAVKQSA